MKTTALLSAIMFSALVSGRELSAPGSTFAPDCTPVAQVAAVPGQYGCFSFTASHVTFTAPGHMYHWSFGDGATATGTNVLHCYDPVTVTTIYTGTLTYLTPALCGVIPLETTFTLQVPPKDAQKCLGPCNGYLQAGKSVTVNPPVTYPEVTILVDFGDGTQVQSQMEHGYQNCGSYIIRTYVRDWLTGDTCLYRCALNIDCADSPTGVGRIYAKGAVVGPNPFNSWLKVRSPGQVSEAVIIDASGRKVYEIQDVLGDNAIEIETAHFPPGIYFLRIDQKEGPALTVKLIKL